MNFIPQGFRHAATLLLTNGARTIEPDASSDTTRTALEHLANQLVALAEDMRVEAGAADWLISEFGALVNVMPQSFDRHGAKSMGASILMRVATRTPEDVEARDLFLIYLPEDRLPVAAPLAIELIKRRVSVAFAEYEVATASQLTAAVERGLSRHKLGALLSTKAFERMHWPIPLIENDRLLILRNAEAPSGFAELAAWVRRRTVSKL